MTEPATRIEASIACLALALAGLGGCNHPRSRDDPSFGAAPTAAPPSATRRPLQPEPVTMPGALAHEQKHAEAATQAASVKNHGELGERLEGDVYFFRLRGLQVCDDAGKVAGVEVEIEAKTKLAVSPRDVVLGRGGITFNASLDFARKLPRCNPILGMTVLRSGEVARGFVLFDVPTRPGNDLTLVYQPTRWGGAGYVSVPLRSWSRAP